LTRIQSGFGGCAVALVRQGAVDAFVAATTGAYRTATGLDAAAYPSREACLTLQGLPAAPDVATYEADLLARLTAGS